MTNEPFDKMAHAVRDALGNGLPTPDERREQRRGVVAYAEAHTKRRGSRPRFFWAWSLTTVAATLLGALVVWRAMSIAPNAWREDGSSVVPGDFLKASADQPLKLRFDDGSRVLLERGGARVVNMHRGNVRIALHEGHVAAEIVPGQSRRWDFELGPYVLVVTGTRFTADWQLNAGALAVVVTEGEVRVRGGILGEEGVPVRSSKKLLVDASGMSLRALVPTAPQTVEPVAPQAMEPVAPPETSPAAPETPQATPPSADAPRAWQRAFEDGKCEVALELARREGMYQALAKAGVDDLTLLADIARCGRDATSAEQALLEMRRRFPKAPRSERAAFLLGRVALEIRNEPRAAAKWFALYLRDYPRGQLYEEALGRLIEAHDRAGDHGAAAAAAKQYLDRYGKGPFADRARRVLP